MVLLIHIALSLLTLCIAAFTLFTPSQLRLKVVYVSTAVTFISGVALMLQTSTNLAHACLSGSIFLGFIVFSSLVARRRLLSIS